MGEDAEVARIIAEEAQRRARLAKKAGVLGYLQSLPQESAGGPAEINKRYLSAEIRSVVGHNRRNQEESCWRERKLEGVVENLGQRDDRRSVRDADNRAPKRPHPESHCDRHSQEDAEQHSEREVWAQRKAQDTVGLAEQQSEREMWAQRKAQAMAKLSEEKSNSGDAGRTVSEDGFISFSGSKAKKEARAKRNKKDKLKRERKRLRKEAKKLKKREHKRTKKTGGSSSSEASSSGSASETESKAESPLAAALRLQGYEK